MKTRNFYLILLITSLTRLAVADSNVIEKQLIDIGSIPNSEVVVVQKKYTKKTFRHEITPIRFGGLPFGDIRNTFFGGASYTLHLGDAIGLELIDFTYTKDFFTSFSADISAGQTAANKPTIKPDVQRLLFMFTPGIQFSPTHGKASTLSHWIAYLEPYFSLNAGLARTEANTYFTIAPGLGMRIFFKEWFSMKVEFRDYIYTETGQDSTGAPKNRTRNNYSVAASLSFWIPKML